MNTTVNFNRVQRKNKNIRRLIKVGYSANHLKSNAHTIIKAKT